MERGKDLILDDIRDGKQLTNNLKEWFDKATAKQNPFLQECEHIKPGVEIKNKEMTREELKAEALINLGSEPAPKEWEKLPEIKEQMPSCIGGEVSLQRFVGTDICAWFVGIGGLWEPQSEYFRVSLPPAEGAEEILQKTTLSDTSVPNVPLSWLIAPESPTWNAVIAAMTEFATLHAQRIADKMVSERLREYHLNEGYDVVIVGNPDKEIPGDIFEDIKVAALELGELRGLKVMITGFTANYLKTRDSHD